MDVIAHPERVIVEIKQGRPIAVWPKLRDSARLRDRYEVEYISAATHQGAVDLLREAEGALFGEGGYTDEQARLAQRIGAFLRPSTTTRGQ